MHTKITRLFAVVAGMAALAAAPSASALSALDVNGDVWDYVGSFDVYDGPGWTGNPPIYSGISAAELVFGAAGTGYIYAISVDQTLSFVTHTAVYDGWGVHDGTILAEDYFNDIGNPGYNDPYGGPAFSAYVQDGGFLFTTPNGDTNFVWKRAVAQEVPDTASTLGLLFVGLGSLVALRRKK